MCKCLYTVTSKNLLLKSLLFLFINTSSEADYSRNSIVIVNSTFLERPQKRSHRNQLIHRRLTKRKAIDRQRSRPKESGRQTVIRLWQMVLRVETGREVWGRR